MSQTPEQIADWAEQRALATQPKPIGRPRKFTDVAELEAAIDAYFLAQAVAQRPFTMAGLARALDCSTMTLRRYEDDTHAHPAFCAPIKRARQRVEEWTEERLYGKGHPAGPIFSLKNNFGWRDEQQVQHQHTLVAVGAAPPPRLSPVVESVSALSHEAENAVSGELVEAKAPPIMGVSPENAG